MARVRGIPRLAAGLCVFAAAAMPATLMAAGGAKTVRVSLKSNGREAAGDPANELASISGGGRYVAFESEGAFVRSDRNGAHDVYVHDRRTGRTVRVSVKSNGKGVAADSELASISADGRMVAFTAEGALVKGDTNGVEDVYVHDRETGRTVRASVGSGGQQGTAASSNPSISGDGRYVAFDSDAQLVPSDQNVVTDVYRRDLATGKTKLVSLRSDGSQPTRASTLSDPTSSATPNRASRISADGRYVVFQTDDSQVTAQGDCCADPLLDTDVFVRDMKRGTTRRVSLSSAGSEADASSQVASTDAAISADGRFVAFQSPGAFTGGDANGTSDIYVRDLKRGKTKRASVSSGGEEGTGASTLASISASGRFVAFESYAALSGADLNGATYRDVYVRDRKLGKTRLVSVRSSGKQVGANHQLAVVSGDGRFVAFQSLGAFTAGDAGGNWDVFERGPLG